MWIARQVFICLPAVSLLILKAAISARSQPGPGQQPEGSVSVISRTMTLPENAHFAEGNIDKSYETPECLRI
ncbi:hypothetical protein E2C01_001711 [Portunus trituberculatus]|uniref:Uncharacterized protein n=1 Tax=Portunus trituberculatus TaxID=210409 RepID=A0A5B7CIR3_PORTR|nr:hypothetical protein [Portunus trituberculatus]